MMFDANDTDSRGMRLLLGGRPRPKMEAAAEPMPEEVAQIAAPAQSQPASEPLPLCVRIPAAGQMLMVGRSTIYKLINAGELETIKVGAAVLITTKSIEGFVQRRARVRQV